MTSVTNVSMSRETFLQQNKNQVEILHPELSNILKVLYFVTFTLSLFSDNNILYVYDNQLTTKDGSSSFTFFVLPLLRKCVPRHTAVGSSPFQIYIFLIRGVKYRANISEDLQGFSY